ncbi:MAG: hypothetical protein Kow001_24460 [Acidobacteriota bacterium]
MLAASSTIGGKTMLHERRKFYRWATGLQCVFEVGGQAHTGQVVNLSFGGARIQTSGLAPPEGADIELTIHRPDYGTSLRAHVFYSESSPQGSVFGVEFYGGFHEKSAKLLPLFRDCAPIEPPPDSTHGSGPAA